jgi:predicted HTH transcriptional regulator
MFDTIETITQQLIAGEDSSAEFKEVRFRERRVTDPNPESFAGEMAAFANAEGGTIFLGVDDEGIVKGIPKNSMRGLEEWIVNIASEGCDPPLRPLIRRVVIPDPRETPQHIMLVQIKGGPYVHRTRGGRWMIRVGSTKRDLSAAELGRLLQERGRQLVFDESPVAGATVGDLDEKALEKHFGKNRAIEYEQLLRNVRVVAREEGDTLRPTVAGLLCFSKEPSRHVPGAWIDAAVYRGIRRHSDDLVHHDAIRGSLNHQIDDAVEFVGRFMLKPARKNVGREDFPQYALGPVHEAIVNAVAHRDYSIAGSKIRLFLYADRLELLSPGGLPNTVTLESLRFRQFTRNQLLVSFLSKMTSQRSGRHFIEERGEGVTRILEESLAHSGREPVYELHGEELALTIWAKPSPHEGRDQE